MDRPDLSMASPIAQTFPEESATGTLGHFVADEMMGNGCFTYFEYDALNRPQRVLNCYPDGSPLVYFEYDYDAAGRITTSQRPPAELLA